MSGAGNGGVVERDRHARERAQREFVSPVVLEAGAGTGKTAVLVARVVVWALGPGWERNAERLEGEPADRVAGETLRRVVAITFTEAAAAEMETRVRDALLLLEAGDRPLGVDPEALPGEAALCSERARALLGCLDQLGVRTIHAWCRRLLAAHPLEVALHPRFQVDADGRRQAEGVREVLERRLAEAYATEESLEDHLDLALEGFGPGEIEQALLYLVEQGVTPEDLDREPFDEDSMARLRRRLQETCEALHDAGSGALVGLKGAKRVEETARFVAEARARLADPQLLACAELVEVFEGWETAHLNALGKWTKGDVGKKGEALIGAPTVAFCEAARQLQARIRHLRSLDPDGLARARRVLAPLVGEVAEELRARGVESFDALLRDACRLAAGPAGARLRAEIDQLLVDEFQDTDGTQCEILRQLVLAAPAEERPGLFLVGDPKQSIYGWRRADLAAWYDFVREVEAEGGEVHRLVVNFRSVPAVLAEVERLVAPVMHARDRVQPVFQALEPSPQHVDAPGFTRGGRRPVEHWVCNGWDAEAGAVAERTRARDATEIEAQAIAADIAELQREHGVAWKDCALLLRSLGDLDLYLGALRSAGIPYVVERDQSYYQRREIIEAQALVRAVLDPLDAVALVAVLRSAWVGVPDAALLPLWHAHLPDVLSRHRHAGEEARAELARLVDAAAAATPREVPGIERIAGWSHSLLAALEAILALRASFESEPADRFVEKLRGALACEVSESARYLGRFRLANHDRFFRDLVVALDETGGDAPEVLAHLRRAVSDRREAEEGRPRDAEDAAVHVTTIHKAKGLGFEHVYLAQIQKQEPADTARDPRAAVVERRLEYRIFGKPTPGFDRTGDDQRLVREAERVRLLYVAVTRAKQRLVVSGARSARDTADPAQAQGFADLVCERRPEAGIAGTMQGLAESGSAVHRDPDGVRWCFPALDPPAPPEAVEAGATPFSPGDALASARELAAKRREGRDREQRPFSGTASAEEALPDERPTPIGSPERREAAQLAGSAVHAALEQMDFRAPSEEVLARAREQAEAVLGREESQAIREPARVRAHSTLATFVSGDLAAKLRTLAGNIVARELPVLVGPGPAEGDPGSADAGDGAGPVGFVSGAIDLLYRDGEDWVVADYKLGEPGDEGAGRHRHQGEIYTRAIREALGLACMPRFELWFIEHGVIQRMAADA